MRTMLYSRVDEHTHTEEKLVNILNEMPEYLNVPQMKDRAVLQEAPFNNMGSLMSHTFSLRSLNNAARENRGWSQPRIRWR